MELNTNLPGIVGLFAYSPQSAKPMKELAEEVLRDPGFSTIEPGKRELIATAVSMWNKCSFCMLSHGAAARQYLGDDFVQRCIDEALPDRPTAQMFLIAAEVTDSSMSRDWIPHLKKILAKPPGEDEEMTELTGREKHDVILIASMFNMYNRYVSHMGVANADLSWDDYVLMGKRIIEVGYANSQS